MIWSIPLAVFFIGFGASAELVRVRLVKLARSVELTGLGLDIAAREDAVMPVSLPKLGRARVQITKLNKGIVSWRIDYPDGRRERALGPTLRVRGDMLRVGLEPVPQNLELHADNSGRIDVVSTMDLDTYLAGVLPAEMPAAWPIEALKAQVVASRSYALNIIRSRRLNHFHLESSVFDQVYRSEHEITLEERHKINRAIKETAGQVLTSHEGQLIRAYYHADCGGETEQARNVWGGEGEREIGTVRDGTCPLSPWANWDFSISKAALRSVLARALGANQDAGLLGLAITGRTPSGRVAGLDVVLTGLGKKSISAHEFRRILGFARLKSTNFSFRWRGEELQISGKGHGHGVGLCQYGTRMLAKSGLGYVEILKNYYPKASLRRDPAVTASAVRKSAALVF